MAQPLGPHNRRNAQTGAYSDAVFIPPQSAASRGPSRRSAQTATASAFAEGLFSPGPGESPVRFTSRQSPPAGGGPAYTGCRDTGRAGGRSKANGRLYLYCWVTQLAVGETVTMPELNFDQSQARLLPPTRTALDQLAAALRELPELRLEVQGHTDNVGSAELNRQLSQQLAEAVCLYITAHGIATAQLRPMGYGGTQPVADNVYPAQHSRNGRLMLRRP